MNQMPTLKFGMGASPRRVEDGSLIRGLGRYTTDVTPAGALTAYVVRSAAGHARIRVGDLSAARSANGVHLVWTAQDVGDLGLMPCLAKPEAKAPIEEPPFPVLCGDVVRHVGDAIAFIVADDLNSAKSAAELIEIDYDTLPAVVDTATALDPGAPLVWPERGSNLAFESEVGNKAAADAAFAAAAQVAELTIVNNRLVCNYMEPRAIVAEYDSATGNYVVTVGSQGVHGIRDAMCKVLKIDPSEMRVLTYDVGGGFGPKTFNYREYPLTVRAAKALGRPVQMGIGPQRAFSGRRALGATTSAAAPLHSDRDGRVLGMRVELIAAMGST
jgi:carbon-monoxide dehydrogenase large subunit